MFAERRDLNSELFSGMYKFFSLFKLIPPLLLLAGLCMLLYRILEIMKFIPLIKLTMDYTSHFNAEMISGISSFWGIEFKKK